MGEPTVDIGEPKTRAEVAIDKLRDPFSGDNLMHITKPETLEPILRNGIVAGEFAERAKILNYRSRFNSSWNRRFVSLVKGPIRMISGGAGIGGSDLIGILVDPMDQVTPAVVGHKGESDRLVPQGHENLVTNRIAPREICGIVLRRNISSNPNMLGMVIKTIEGIEPSLAVPVYREAEGLVWPVKMSPEELAERVRAK